jgi:hypothetical protein
MLQGVATTGTTDAREAQTGSTLAWCAAIRSSVLRARSRTATDDDGLAIAAMHAAVTPTVGRIAADDRSYSWASQLFPTGCSRWSTVRVMRTRLLPLIAVSLSAAGGICASIATAAAVPGDCLAAGSGGSPATGKPIDPPIKFHAVPPATTRNFGSDRKRVDAVFKLTTDKALPKGIEQRLELVADPMLRVGDTTDSASFPEPTFSRLWVSQNRTEIRFRTCLDPTNDLPAGKYVGIISLEGPSGVESTAVTITANAKDGGVFRLSAIGSLVLAFFILLYKGADGERARLKMEAEKLPDDEPRTAALRAAENFWRAAWTTLKDPRWLVPTLFAVGGAGGALWAIYDANPSWGEAGPVTSAFAIIGAALAAIGARENLIGGR